MTAQRSFGQRLWGLPAALGRRLLHQWALLRARRLTLARAAARPPRRLLVMCYGNIYRSPFVATRLGQALSSQTGIEIRSAGFHPAPNRPSPPEFVRLTKDFGLDLDPHRSRLVAPADLEWAEGIVIMDRYNWERLRPFGAEIQGKVLWLGAFAGNGPVEIQDPYGQSPARVLSIVKQMQAATDGLVERLRGTV